MQWIEGRLGAARAITRYLATYPPSYAARQVGWLADTLELDHTTITRELASAYETAHTLPARAPRPAPTISLAR
jgi:hypothetical protein